MFPQRQHTPPFEPPELRYAEGKELCTNHFKTTSAPTDVSMRSRKLIWRSFWARRIVRRSPATSMLFACRTLRRPWPWRSYSGCRSARSSAASPDVFATMSHAVPERFLRLFLRSRPESSRRRSSYSRSLPVQTMRPSCRYGKTSRSAGLGSGVDDSRLWVRRSRRHQPGRLGPATLPTSGQGVSTSPRSLDSTLPADDRCCREPVRYIEEKPRPDLRSNGCRHLQTGEHARGLTPGSRDRQVHQAPAAE